jgi:V8-like Glu-specific endopeptidase
VGTALVHPSYGRDRPYLLSADSSCRVRGQSEGVLLTDCDTNFGGSGGPVLVRENGRLRLLAVMVGIANRRNSVAVEVSQWRALRSASSCK